MGVLLPVIQHVATQTYKTSYPTVHKYCTESRFINKNNISKNIKHRTCWSDASCSNNASGIWSVINLDYVVTVYKKLQKLWRS